MTGRGYLGISPKSTGEKQTQQHILMLEIKVHLSLAP